MLDLVAKPLRQNGSRLPPDALGSAILGWQYHKALPPINPCCRTQTFPMRTDDFDFELPETLIAQHPIEPRDAARLLLIGARRQDQKIVNLPDLLSPGDVLVANDTKVLPVRLFGYRGEVAVEATLLEELRPDRWLALAKPGKRLKPGQRIDFGDELSAELQEKLGDGRVMLHFDSRAGAVSTAIEKRGAMPLPPYIRRQRGGNERDRESYQTIFAARPGAVAAPTAGLHFTQKLVARLDERGVNRAVVTLRVGAGTFVPVKCEDPRAHPMHAEWGEISASTAATINQARRRGRRVVAVGTTVLRLLESAANVEGQIRPFSGKTDIFILPGYRFRAVDRLLTNFHLPRSSLFMLVAAFSGLARMHEAYGHAVAQGYRFYSYGDACLLDPS